jgi:hypothetical protein
MRIKGRYINIATDDVINDHIDLILNEVGNITYVVNGVELHKVGAETKELKEIFDDEGNTLGLKNVRVITILPSSIENVPADEMANHIKLTYPTIEDE